MNVCRLSVVMVVSFVICAVTISGLELVFWVSMAIFSWSCIYVSRHKDSLLSELDKIFGSDEEFR